MGMTGLGSAAVDGADGPVLAFLRILVDDAPPATIATALARGLLASWSPTRLSAYFLDGSGEYLEETIQYDPPPQAADTARVPMSVRAPLTDVVRLGEAGAWTVAEAAASYPAVAGWVDAQPDRAQEEILIVPIRARAQTVGALIVSWPAPTERTWRLHLITETAATALGLWWTGADPTRMTARKRGGSRGVAVTDRQHRILDGVRRGRSNRQIATELGISPGTVKSDLAQLYRNFGVPDRNAIAALLDGHGP